MKNFFAVAPFVICLMIISCVSRTMDHKDQLQGKKIFTCLDASFVLDTILAEIKVPYSMDWLPDGVAIISDRSKQENGMLLLNSKTGETTSLCNVPVVTSRVAAAYWTSWCILITNKMAGSIFLTAS